MGYDKYGLNWKVWGNTPSKPEKDKGASQQQSGSGTQKGKEQSKKSNTNIEETSEQPKEKLQPEYRIKSLRIVTPPEGFRQNAPFDIEGEVENIRIKITRPRIVLFPLGKYKGEEDLFVPGGIETFVDTKTLKFKGTCKNLCEPEAYARDSGKPASASWELVVRAEGNAAEKPFESKPLKFPQPDTFQILQKDDYDEHGAKKYSKPESGEHFKPNGLVKALQTSLITADFLVKGSDDGYFGEQTDKAVHSFQEFAIKPERMKRKVGKIETTAKKLEQAQPDGIVGKKTREELDRWVQNDWIKPLPPLRHGDVDDNGVKKGKGKLGSDEHHQGTPIVNVQKDLQKTDAYTGAVDGWFWDKMKNAVTQFQDAAVKGQFLINGVLTDIGEKLTGHRKGTLDAPTQEMLKKVVEKGGKVEKKEKTYVFPLPKTYQDKGYHKGERSFGSGRSDGTRAHAGCDLYAGLGKEIFSVADGIILDYYNYYWKTFALTVDHGDFIVLYGEVQPPINPEKHGITLSKDVMAYIAKLQDKEKLGLPGNLKKGDPVKKGQHIAYVGQLYTRNGSIPYKHTMLHFEKYKRTTTGALTQVNYNGSYENLDKDKKNLKFKRRKDLENPTEFLDNCELTN
jgi:peptidoglycan hydrolase-like protein with peptidoglycan-binding domain